MVLEQLENRISHTNKRAKPDEFWMQIIERYIDQITLLEEEKNIRSEGIDNLEVALLPYISSKFAQLSEEDLRNNVDQILGLDMQSCFEASCEERSRVNDKENIPDLGDISVFSIDKADVQYMDIIKEYAADEDKLRKDIKKLKQQYMALEDERIEVRESLNTRGNKKVEVDAGLMRATNSRLIEENASLKRELEAIKNSKESESSLNVRDELEKYRKVISTTQEKLHNYKNRAWHSESLKSCQDMASKIQNINKKVEEQRIVNEQLKEQIFKLSSCATNLQNKVIVKKRHEYEEM